MAPTLVSTRAYPRVTPLGEWEVNLRLMQSGDREMIVKFAKALHEDDLLFMPMDITRPEVIDDWMHQVETGHTITLLAEHEGELLGYVSLMRDRLQWTRHHGEVLVLVNPEYRARGLGRWLIEEVLSIAEELRLHKVVAKMTSGHEGAWRMFENLRFNLEAVLANWVIDRKGKTQDLVIMSRELMPVGS